MTRKMLINAVDSEEIRIAILEDSRLCDFRVQSAGRRTLLGNIYKGRVTSVLASLQAAFVDYGVEKHGFLHVTDIIRPIPVPGSPEERAAARKAEAPPSSEGGGRKVIPKIDELLRVGQEVLVQITRDGMGTKGPSMTMDLSLPGRYLVLMPGSTTVGVSRKIEDDKLRRDLKVMLQKLDPPPGVGYIIRTAGIEKSRTDLRRDLDHLGRLWKSILARVGEVSTPYLLYEESDLVTRAVRDHFATDISELLVDDETVHSRLDEFFRSILPRYRNRLRLYDGGVPLFWKYGVETQIHQIYERKVELPDGGSVVFDPTEALVAVDVNSGRLTRNLHPEELALRTNLQAAEEIARQLQLRDLGGLIVIDFIDMRESKNRGAVEKVLRDHLRRDRAQTKVLKTSTLGLIQMVRQRMGTDLKTQTYESCSLCRGAGQVRTPMSMATLAVRQIRRHMLQADVGKLEVHVHPDVAQVLVNEKREVLAKLEARYEKRVVVQWQAGAWRERVDFVSHPKTEEERSRAMPPPEVAKAAAVPAVAAPPEVGAAPKAESDSPEARPARRGRRRRGRRRPNGASGRPMPPAAPAAPAPAVEPVRETPAPVPGPIKAAPAKEVAEAKPKAATTPAKGAKGRRPRSRGRARARPGGRGRRRSSPKKAGPQPAAGN